MFVLSEIRETSHHFLTNVSCLFNSSTSCLVESLATDFFQAKELLDN